MNVHFQIQPYPPFLIIYRIEWIIPELSTNQELPKAQRIDNPPRLLTLKQASAYLGLSLWAMRERVWAGKIPYCQFESLDKSGKLVRGRKIYLDRTDLDKFIEAN